MQAPSAPSPRARRTPSRSASVRTSTRFAPDLQYTLSLRRARGDRIADRVENTQSLLSLGRVITCLKNKERKIPYRDSKLTRLLQVVPLVLRAGFFY